MSEYLTAVWNGFQIGAEDAEAAVDKLAAVGANSGANLQELATGMSKVAAVAKVLGMSLDQLNAMMATIQTVTRQAPQSKRFGYKNIKKLETPKALLPFNKGTKVETSKEMVYGDMRVA